MKCLNCNAEGDGVKITKDHVIPKAMLKTQLSRRDYARWCQEARKINIQPLCAECNSKKGARAIDLRNIERRIHLKYLSDRWGLSIEWADSI